MNDEDKRSFRAWRYCESVLGPILTNELRQGRSIYVAARNGMVYEIGPYGYVANVTHNQVLCVNMDIYPDTDYHRADRIAHRFDHIIHNPEKFEEEAEPEISLDSVGGRNRILTGSELGNPRRFMERYLTVGVGVDERARILDTFDNITQMGERIGTEMGRMIRNNMR